MEDGSVPPDPWSPPPPEWEVPPLRYPKGLERIRRPEDYKTSALRRKPRPPQIDRNPKASKRVESKDEEFGCMDLLRSFVRDETLEVYYQGVGLPGEGKHDHLDLMRRCLQEANTSDREQQGNSFFKSLGPSLAGQMIRQFQLDQTFRF